MRVDRFQVSMFGEKLVPRASRSCSGLFKVVCEVQRSCVTQKASDSGHTRKNEYCDLPDAQALLTHASVMTVRKTTNHQQTHPSCPCRRDRRLNRRQL